MATSPCNLSPAENNMPPTKASLMGLPAKLRLPIYEQLFRSANCLVVYNLYAELYHYLSGPPIDTTKPEAFTIIRTYRRIREEASEFIFSQVEIMVRVMDTRVSLTHTARVQTWVVGKDCGHAWMAQPESTQTTRMGQ